jgi:hypothetical protein
VKLNYYAYLAFLINFPVWAQLNHSILQTTDHVTNILTDKNLQTNTTIAKETSKLEDLNASNECPSEIDTHESCQGFAISLVPQGYKDKGWKTLLEIKYQPVEQRTRSSTASANYQNYNFAAYRLNTGDQASDLITSADLDAETKNIQDWFMARYGTSPAAFDVRTQLIIDQLTNPDFTKSDTDMMNKIKNYSATMNDQEFTRFVSSIAGYVDYNDERAAFEQTPEGGLGIVTPFQQMMGTKYGVCGDVHSMAAKIAEQRGWEAFTVGYSLEGMQHVVTAMVNPNDPNKLMIVNYGHYEEHTLNDGNSVNPTPTAPGWEDIGTQMRIFKNDKTGDGLGKMQQIATVPTAFGSFMTDLFKKEYQISKAMPSNENFRSEKVGGETTKHVTKLKNDGNKITDKLVTEGLIIYEGQTDNAQVYGIAVSHDVYKDIYRWDPEEKRCVLKKNKYFSLGIAGSLVDLTQAGFDDTFYAYLNMKGGQIFHVYQSEHFQFKGIIGYELDGFVAKYDQGLLTGDANFATLLGVIANYNKNGTAVHLGLTYETNVTLRNQNLMTDISSLPSNINPIGFNALSLDANLTHKINSNTTFVTNNNLTMTRVGGRVVLSTGIIHNNTTIMASYQRGVKPLPIGNTLQTVNLLQNFNNMDGFRLSASQNFSNKKGNFSGTVSGYGGISTSTIKPMPMAGATLKLNLGGTKRKPSSRR